MATSIQRICACSTNTQKEREREDWSGYIYPSSNLNLICFKRPFLSVVDSCLTTFFGIKCHNQTPKQPASVPPKPTNRQNKIHSHGMKQLLMNTIGTCKRKQRYTHVNIWCFAKKSFWIWFLEITDKRERVRKRQRKNRNKNNKCQRLKEKTWRDTHAQRKRERTRKWNRKKKSVKTCTWIWIDKRYYSHYSRLRIFFVRLLDRALTRSHRDA